MPDLLDLLSVDDIIQTARRGFERFEQNRQTMKLTVQQMAGQYYSRTSGDMCQMPLALSYNAARVLLPNLVMSFPRHIVDTPFLPARQYAEDLGNALSIQDRKLKIDNVYRRVIMDSLHALGILKTGIASGGTIVELEDEDGTSKIDTGTIYTERVSFNNFVADPDSREYLFSDARFLGDIIRVPRKVLLDSGLYDEDEVQQLGAGDHTGKRKTAANISMKTTEMIENDRLEDIVEICELYIPSANVIVTIPGDFRKMEKFLRVADYYGIKDQTGPYTFLSLTMPVPDNPMPTPFFSVLLDLEMKANRMENKLSNQAERQKDLFFYKRDTVDDAALVRDASDGEMIACDDPNDVVQKSLGGQQQGNEEHLQMLLTQYNSIAANVETLSGTQSAAKSATAANILQQNSGIVLSDMKDAIYRAAEEEGRKRAFYIHHDPFLNETLTRRTMQPGQLQQLPTGPHWITPPSIKEIQVILTPEDREGDFLDMVFRIEPESMGRMDSKVALQQKMTFCQQVLPAVSATAQIFQTLGIPFDVPVFLMKLASDMNILWLDEVLFSPEIQQKTALDYQRIQTQTGGDVQPGHANQPNPNLNNQIMQNGQPAAVMGPQQGQAQQMNSGAQAGAMDSQRLIRTALSHALGGGAPKPALPQLGAGQ